MQATISSQRRIHIYEGSSKYRQALLHLSFQNDTIVPLPFLTTKLQSYFLAYCVSRQIWQEFLLPGAFTCQQKVVSVSCSSIRYTEIPPAARFERGTTTAGPTLAATLSSNTKLQRQPQPPSVAQTCPATVAEMSAVQSHSVQAPNVSSLSPNMFKVVRN
jgi:hypothetical protein